ncbi:S8 family peptidase [Microbulbifer agarilyticus]|uniref:S8 family peptidase n=1 Tax=Microbulbifer agarilyticus TaxID=260552 RepID=UPI001CD55E98|nr:S8 family serine peptidase [Microbulbifer agarilyticus]MCA0901518.1 S8 family serine peptidase [Microbulbifer agarilyticus]
MFNKACISSITAIAASFVFSSVASADSWVLVGHGNQVKESTIQEVMAAGGQIRHNISEIGVLVVEGDASLGNSLSAVKGIKHIGANGVYKFQDPLNEMGVSLDYAGNPPFSGDDDFFFDLQWGHDAVDAPEAWNAGNTGAGVRVAVIDGGYDLGHPDLAQNIDYAASMDFTGEGLAYALPDTFSHGTHVAGTIAAADNAFGVIGVAPDATLILLKGLGDAGSGSFGDVAAAIVHAANVDADVLNMSLGASFPASAEGAAALKVMMSRATNYAHQAGVTIITSAGNDARDGDKDTNMVTLPADSPHAISISATGPQGWGAGNTELNYLAVYSNYGQSLIDFAAPGGDYQYYLANNDVCTVGPLTRICGVFDFVFSTGNGGWYWSVGTSMASPHAAGVAALIIGANGGEMHPAQVEAEMAHLSADLGKPGNDDVYGAGMVQSPK